MAGLCCLLYTRTYFVGLFFVFLDFLDFFVLDGLGTVLGREADERVGAAGAGASAGVGGARALGFWVGTGGVGLRQSDIIF